MPPGVPRTTEPTAETPAAPAGAATRVVVLGSTGSVGCSALDVIGRDGGARLRAWGLGARSSVEALVEQARAHRPRYIALADPAAAARVNGQLAGTGVELLAGPDGLAAMAAAPEADRVLSAVVGAAGLAGTWAAVEAGKIVALANKETLVVAGPLVMDLARRRGATILPVDSEHSAIFQCLRSGAAGEVRRVILTSSGGPFRGKSRRELEGVTPAQALRHPTWRMGPKISVDSATLMNKALEVIEARWLFGLEPDQIEVVVHPESVVHSMVEFVDGSVVAQLSPPDMRLPVQYALTYPDRVPGPCPRLDLTAATALTFEPPDRETFPCLDLGFEVMRRGGTAGAALNAANEAAVARFLAGTIGFHDIPRACRAALDHHTFDSRPALADLWKVDARARQEVGSLENVIWLVNILKVALGLGFVIFLHELGHFLLAKWNGVKVEKFSIGFGPTLLGFKKGETEYVLAAVPLGGFVKMLGEGPEDEANKSSDPRAYPNKSVGARMAIISAGVIMNLILGLACFVYAYEMGMDEESTVVGGVYAGSPAYRAGILPGDEIVSIDGRRDLNYQNVKLKIRLSGQGQVLHFELKRPGRDQLIPVDIEPLRSSSSPDVPGIGIINSFDLKLAPTPFQAPAGLAETPKEPAAGLKPNDRVTAAGPVGTEPRPVADIQDFYRQLTKFRAEPIQLVLRRETKREAAPGRTVTDVTRATVTLPPNRFVDFGFRLKAEPITALRDGSPADRAGFHTGDTIVAVDGRDDFDPMRLPTYIYEHAGKPVSVEVERAGPQRVTLNVTPDDSMPWTEWPFKGEPLDVPGLGLAFPVRTKVEAVTPGSPAAKAGIKPGDVINALSFPAKPAKKKAWPFRMAQGNSRPAPDVTFDDQANWPYAFQAIQFLPREPITLRVNNSSTPVVITPEPDPAWSHPFRGVVFEFLIRRTPPLTIAAALRRGADDTVDNILSIYATFRSLAQSRVSPKNLGGPILISQVAYDAAVMGLTDLVHFLGILSINLAVLNFLPVPPLDGGQMVFLLAEKVRGRPLPESALAAGTWMGVVMVLMLMAFVFYQDISRLVISYF